MKAKVRYQNCRPVSSTFTHKKRCTNAVFDNNRTTLQYTKTPLQSRPTFDNCTITMNLALSTSLLATIGLSAARNLDGIANAVASGEKETARELSTADAGNKPDGRLFKVKGGIDAGILGFSRNLASTCPDTCSPELCDCVEEFGYAEPCYQQ